MKQRALVGLLVVLVVVFASLASAGSSYDNLYFFGLSGLLLTPNADMLAGQQVVGSTYQSGARDVDTYNATVGLQGTTELSLSQVDFRGTPDDETIISGKTNLPVKGSNGKSLIPFKLAVGVLDITDQLDRSLFLVASEDWKLARKNELLPKIRLSAGVGDGMFDGLFFGAEANWVFGLGAVAEYDSNDWNWGVKYTPPSIPQLTATAAWLDGDDAVIGLTYNFGLKK